MVAHVEELRQGEHAKVMRKLLNAAQSPERTTATMFRPGGDPIRRIW